MTLGQYDTVIKNATDPELKKSGAEVKKIFDAIIDSFGVPDWQKSAIEKGSASAKSDAGGLWSSVKSFFANIFSSGKEMLVDDAKGAFKKDLSLLSIEEIIKVKPEMEKAKKALIGATEKVSTQATSATANAAASANPKAAEKQGNAPAQSGATAAQAPAQSGASAAAPYGAQSSIAKNASSQPLGKSILSVIRKFAEPYKDNREFMGSLDDLVKPTRQILGSAEDQIYQAIINKWDEWSESLPDKAKLAIYGDPESENYEDKKKNIDDNVDTQLKGVIAASLKMEAARRIYD